MEGFSAVVHPLPEDFGGTMEEMCRHVEKYPQWVLAVVVPMWAVAALVGTWMAEDRKPLFLRDRWAVVAVGSRLQSFHAALSDLVQGRELARCHGRNRRWQSFFRTPKKPQANVMSTCHRLFMFLMHRIGIASR